MAGKPTRLSVRPTQSSSQRKPPATSQSPPRRSTRVTRGQSHDISDNDAKKSTRNGNAVRGKGVQELPDASENIVVEQGMQEEDKIGEGFGKIRDVEGGWGEEEAVEA